MENKALEYLIYTTIFFIPSYLIRFDVFGISTNMLEMLVLIIFTAFLIRRTRNKELRIKDFIISKPSFFTHNSLFFVGTVLLLLGLALGVFISPDIATSLGALKSWFFVPLVFAVVAGTVLNTEQKRQNALTSLALSGAGVAVVSLFYWFSGSLTFDGRLAGFYESPNMLAMYIAPAILILSFKLLYILFPSGKGFTTYDLRFTKVRIFLNHKSYFVNLIILLLVLYLTHSLGSFMGLAATVLVYLSTVYWGKKLDNLWKTGIIVILLLGLLLPLSALFVDPWELDRGSLASRFMIWQASVEILKDNWLLGIGPGTFQEFYLAYQQKFPPYLEWAVPHPHNIFLTTWLYGGLLGLAGFAMVLFAPFLHKPYSLASVTALMIIIYVLIHGSIDNTLWRNDVAVMFWLAVVFSAKAQRNLVV